MPFRPAPRPGRNDATFIAFRQCYQSVYFRHAHARLGSSALAAEALEAALAELADTWHAVLRDPSLPAATWTVLAAHIAARERTRSAGELMPPEEADMLVLRYRLGLTVGEAAALMGMDKAAFAARLGATVRRLGASASIFAGHIRDR